MTRILPVRLILGARVRSTPQNMTFDLPRKATPASYGGGPMIPSHEDSPSTPPRFPGRSTNAGFHESSRRVMRGYGFSSVRKILSDRFVMSGGMQKLRILVFP